MDYVDLVILVRLCIELDVKHWFHIENKEYVPDVSYAFLQTLDQRFGLVPENDDEVKRIRNTFHEIYLIEYKGVYKLDLDKTYKSPFNTILSKKKYEHYKNYVSIVKTEENE